MNLKVQVGTRRARLTAGFPEELWHIVMQGFCFCVGWWFAAMRGTGLMSTVYTAASPPPRAHAIAARKFVAENPPSPPTSSTRCTPVVRANA